MASLVLGIAGSALGPTLFGTGFSVLGATLTGAEIGGALGSLAGTLIDSAIAPGTHVSRTGSRLSDVNIQASTEGAPIPRLYGRVRAAGQLLWATRFKETRTTTTSGGGKGGGVSVTQTDYSYSISFAVGLCGGEISKLGRVWADGNLIDLSQYTTRLYPGSETQVPDPLIEEIEGAGNTPAYRGLAYLVFEDLPLKDFGNRIPQLQFEIIRALSADNADAAENRLAAVALIPGAGEFVYDTQVVSSDDGQGGTAPQNAHNSSSETDLAASLDELQALAPNVGAVSLVVGWFGDDLRCGHIEIKPGVETASRTTYPESWSVNGVARTAAHVVSQVSGRLAYGGTPSDQSVVAAIQNLRSRGLSVLFNPFLFMDIAAGNALVDPTTGAAPQPPYPWRGRITCDPAPGVSGSPDQSATAATQVNAFFGSASPSDFTVLGTTVRYSGAAEWSWRRMVLHYAHLCAAAGGVEAFLIGSELIGLTHVRDSATTYPAAAALKALAADVRTILGSGTRIGYAADWSEYASHQTGGGALLFHLDPLWADANIDFIGIDNYLPLSDWRDGTAHLDYNIAGPTSIHDPTYLTANIRGGEAYDWYYASDADRAAQLRTPITDGLGKPWVWRAKDVWNWWSNAHYDRPDGTESASPTAWLPQSKPIWFTELGCPAVNKGANQPNVFTDPKSAESALPYYSNGARDDLIQRRFLEAQLKFWADAANNPVSSVYAAPMVDVAHIHLWCWDARPFPFFPALSNVWGDAPDYTLGHWLNGRLGAVQLPDLVAALCAEADFAAYDVSNLSGLVTGFALTDTISPRDALTPLGVAFHFDAVESEGVIKFVARGRPTATAISEADLVLPSGDPGFGYALTRAQETDLPLASRLAYLDADADYRQASAQSRRLVGASNRIAQSSLPLVLDQGQAIAIASRTLMEAWVARETAAFALPPSFLALDPADEVRLSAGGRAWRLRLTEIDDGAGRQAKAMMTDPSLYEDLVGPSRAPGMIQVTQSVGRPLVVFLDLPLLKGDEIPYEPYATAYAEPWPGAVLLLKSATTSDYVLDTTLSKAATIGETIADFSSGPCWRWDRVNALQLKLYSGTLMGRDELSVLGGANALAVQNADGAWEVLQFASATLTAPNSWTLTGLLRGQAGTEGAMRDSVAAGARVVVLDGAPKQLALTQSQYALPFHWLYGPQGKPISDSSYQSAALQFQGIGLRPYSPAQVTAEKSGGDLVFGWIRRTRLGGDSWDQSEVPLAEETEAYELDIYNGSAVVRTLSAAAPAATYAAAAIAADFPGGLPSPLTVAVYQLSTAFGRGAGKQAAFYFA
ncbi:MAG: glycoside hydrolase TIM-barrel-like domain-containing protein [Alphaproteobacteria bacterium]|nr:glycoside hydrolase TIM-barrel-like domain-containing protein [Alphaproteobacteria bacterium]